MALAAVPPKVTGTKPKLSDVTMPSMSSVNLAFFVSKLGEMEEGCGEFLEYLEYYQRELLRRKEGDWRSWGQVMETKEGWAARREGKVKEGAEKWRGRRLKEGEAMKREPKEDERIPKKKESTVKKNNNESEGKFLKVREHKEMRKETEEERRIRKKRKSKEHMMEVLEKSRETEERRIFIKGRETEEERMIRKNMESKERTPSTSTSVPGSVTAVMTSSVKNQIWSGTSPQSTSA